MEETKNTRDPEAATPTVPVAEPSAAPAVTTAAVRERRGWLFPVAAAATLALALVVGGVGGFAIGANAGPRGPMFQQGAPGGEGPQHGPRGPGHAWHQQGPGHNGGPQQGPGHRPGPQQAPGGAGEPGDSGGPGDSGDETPDGSED